ncbi:hypothetical protein ACFSQD_18200 [Flavihumibacter stibioxidans]|uniref:Lipocalin-like domain-containing protein n=1 Tax=Flavihumibacter stibioxidans TaxID=1834163 RepID=A0ABR7MCG2_9BACT|nr:hypothetical protein [Flavihumibacter stibioxidans]MBC6492656.1 hypothetical protein [Flavihumibacter stibioxidans]
MRLHYLILPYIILLLAACHKCTEPPPNIPAGTYKGSFQRLHQENSPIAEVSITFNYPAWSGTSSILNYPALGSGTFSYPDDSYFTFNNTFQWTTDFDHTLILHGDYIDQVKGDSLFITKSYGNGWIDVYKLQKQ